MLLLKKKQELLKDDIVTVSIRIRKLLNRNDDTLEQSGWALRIPYYRYNRYSSNVIKHTEGYVMVDFVASSVNNFYICGEMILPFQLFSMNVLCAE